MTLRHLLPPALLLTAALILTSCASQIRPVGPVSSTVTRFNVQNKANLKLAIEPEYLRTVRPAMPMYDDRLKFEKKNRGKRIPIVPVSTEAGETTRTVTFVIAPPTWETRNPWKTSPKKTEGILFTVRERLYRYMLRAYPHPVRVRYAFAQADLKTRSTRVITIRARITDLKEGYGLPRYLIGYGMGAAFIQLEGEIYDGASQESLLGTFVIRRNHTGYAQNGLNPQVLQADYCLRYAADEAILELTQEIARHISGVEVLPPKSPTASDLAKAGE